MLVVALAGLISSKTSSVLARSCLVSDKPRDKQKICEILENMVNIILARNSCQIFSISKVYHSTPFWRPSDLGPIQTGLCCQRSKCKVTSVSYQTLHLTVFLLEQQQFDKVFPLYWTRSLWSSWPFTSEIRDVVVLLQHGQRGGVQV